MFMKTCIKCNDPKEDSQYATGRNVCKPCRRAQKLAYDAAHSDKKKAARRTNYHDNLERDKQSARRGALRRKYSLTIEEYETLCLTQNHTCAICHQVGEGRRLAVDHSHVTGKVRALLCDSCNRGLGFFHDDTTVLAAAIAYLTRNI